MINGFATIASTIMLLAGAWQSPPIRHDLQSQDIKLPVAYLPAWQPATRSFQDQAFGTLITRVSTAREMTNNADEGLLPFISNEYSSVTPFNEGATHFLLLHSTYFALYDADGRYLKDLPFSVNASSEPRWSRHDPDIFYFINGNQLNSYSVKADQKSVVHIFEEYSAISGKGEADICFDGDHLVLSGDDRDIFVYDIAADRKGKTLDTGGRAFDSLYITPDDHVLVTWYATGSDRYSGIEMFDMNMAFIRRIAPVGGHMDVTRDASGEEVLVWANAADPQPVCPNAVVKIRLKDAVQTCLLTLDWRMALHISAADRGQLVVTTYDPTDPVPPSGWVKYTNEILQIKPDGSIKRLAHHRSRPLNSYNYMPRASVSRDGRRLVYSSNYGLQDLGYPAEYSDVYLIDIVPPVKRRR